MAASTSSRAARRAGQLAAPRPSSAGQDEEDDEAGHRDHDVGDPLLLAARRRRRHPRAVPTTTPMMAPNRDRMTDSERIIDRTWRRRIPTARSRPISWVRSNTESISVFTMPMRAMTMARASRT